jgi:hypothetical protein
LLLPHGSFVSQGRRQVVIGYRWIFCRLVKATSTGIHESVVGRW